MKAAVLVCDFQPDVHQTSPKRPKLLENQTRKHTKTIAMQHDLATLEAALKAAVIGSAGLPLAEKPAFIGH